MEKGIAEEEQLQNSLEHELFISEQGEEADGCETYIDLDYNNFIRVNSLLSGKLEKYLAIFLGKYCDGIFNSH